MAAEEREQDTSVRQSLFKEYYSFSFFKAVHLLERLFRDKKPLGRTLTPNEEVVRFSVKPGFVFPPSDLSGMSHEEREKPPEMEVAFMGLIGPSGVLPHWYNQLAMERNSRKDFSLTAFFNLFHHRLISLFYLAWKKYRFPENYLAGGEDRLSRYVLSLIGLGTPGLTQRIGLPNEPLIFYSGLLSRPVPSACAIEATVEFFAETSVAVEQFIDRLLPLNKEDQTQIGLANGELGVNAVCGSFVWENQTKFRVRLGPMGYGRFIRFLPSGDMLQPIFSLIRYMTGIEYEFEVRPYLKREEVPPCILGATAPDSPRLGWSTWAKSPGFIHKDDPYVTFQIPESLL